METTVGSPTKTPAKLNLLKLEQTEIIEEAASDQATFNRDDVL